MLRAGDGGQGGAGGARVAYEGVYDPFGGMVPEGGAGQKGGRDGVGVLLGMEKNLRKGGRDGKKGNNLYQNSSLTKKLVVSKDHINRPSKLTLSSKIKSSPSPPWSRPAGVCWFLCDVEENR